MKKSTANKLEAKRQKKQTNRLNITIDYLTMERAEKLQELHHSSFKNLLVVLIEREWSRLFGETGKSALGKITKSIPA